MHCGTRGELCIHAAAAALLTKKAFASVRRRPGCTLMAAAWEMDVGPPAELKVGHAFTPPYRPLSAAKQEALH